jgi:hypothetical protein
MNKYQQVVYDYVAESPNQQVDALSIDGGRGAWFAYLQQRGFIVAGMTTEETMDLLNHLNPAAKQLVDLGILRHKHGIRGYCITGVSPVPNFTFSQVLAALLKLCTPADKDIANRFKQTRAKLPIVSPSEFIQKYAQFQPVVLGRSVDCYYGKELHITHLVGESLMSDSKKNDLRFGDAILATPDVNAAMSHFKVSYFGDVSVAHMPERGLFLRVKNASENFSVRDSTALVSYPETPFNVFDVDGQPIPIQKLLRNSAEMQDLLIKYKVSVIASLSAKAAQRLSEDAEKEA